MATLAELRAATPKAGGSVPPLKAKAIETVFASAWKEARQRVSHLDRLPNVTTTVTIGNGNTATAKYARQVLNWRKNPAGRGVVADIPVLEAPYFAMILAAALKTVDPNVWVRCGIRKPGVTA